MPDSPDPSDEHPGDESLGKANEEGGAVAASSVDAGRDPCSETWAEHVEDKKDECHGG